MAVAPDAHAVDTVRHGPREAEPQRQQRRRRARHEHRNRQRADAAQPGSSSAVLLFVGGRRAEPDAADDGAALRRRQRRGRSVERVLRRADRELMRPVEPAPLDRRQIRRPGRSRRPGSPGRGHPAGSRSSVNGSAVDVPAHSDVQSSSTVHAAGRLHARRRRRRPVHARPCCRRAGVLRAVQLPAISSCELSATGSTSVPSPVARSRAATHVAERLAATPTAEWPADVCPMSPFSVGSPLPGAKTVRMSCSVTRSCATAMPNLNEVGSAKSRPGARAGRRSASPRCRASARSRRGRAATGRR